MVEANVDKIMQALNEKNTLSISNLSKKLSLPKEDVQKSVEYLEEDGVVKIDHKFPGSTVTLLKKDTVKKPEMPPPPIQEPKPIEQPVQQPSQLPAPEKDSSQTLPAPPNKEESKLPPPPSKDTLTLPQPPAKDLTNNTPELPPPPQKGETPASPGDLNKDKTLEAKPILDLPKPPEVKDDKPKIEQQPIEQKPGQALQPPFEKKDNKPFLIDEQKPEEPKIITPTQGENTQASLDIMQPSPTDNLQNKEPEKFDLENNPLNNGKPKFEMKAPAPLDYPVFPSMGAPTEMKTNTGKSRESPMSANLNNSVFPSHVESELDKIEYLLDKLDNQLNNHNYKDINTLYRQIYDMYNNSYDLSINERTLVNDRINQIYQKLKRVYIIEGVT